MSEALTKAELEEAKRLEAAATMGPWIAEAWSYPLGDSGDYDHLAMIYFEPELGKKVQVAWLEEVCKSIQLTNMTFITFARSFVPRAVAAIEQRDRMIEERDALIKRLATATANICDDARSVGAQERNVLPESLVHKYLLDEARILLARVRGEAQHVNATADKD